MAVPYTDVDAVIADVLKDVKSDSQKESVGRLILAASGLVDKFTNRPSGYFAALEDDSDPTARRYRGHGRNFLQIGRHVGNETDDVTVDNFASTLFYIHPENGWLYASDVSGFGDAWGNGPETYGDSCLFRKNVVYVVNARWGFAAIPDEIVMSTKQIVQHIWDRGKGVIGQISPSGFVIERDMPVTARTILETWVKRDFELN